MAPLEKNRQKPYTLVGGCGEGLAFKKGDRVRWRNYPGLQGTIEDGWLIRKEAGTSLTGTPTITYLIRVKDGVTFKAVPSEIELAG